MVAGGLALTILLRVLSGLLGRVTDGARTRDLRDHNPMLCQLSYDHQASPKRPDDSTSKPHALQKAGGTASLLAVPPARDGLGFRYSTTWGT